MQWVRNARNANTENKRITHAHTAKWTNETEAAGESKEKKCGSKQSMWRLLGA